MTYPHRFDLGILDATYCRCGAGGPCLGSDDEECPAAMKDHIADLSRHEASIHKAAARAVEAERAAAVEWLRLQKGSAAAWFANAIERGDHLKEQA